MLRFALFFFLLAIVAGLLGFTSIAGASFAVAKILFFIFIVFWLVLFVLGITIYKRVT